MDNDIKRIVGDIPPFDQQAAEQARQRWDSLGKPRGSLGLLEKAVVRIAGLTGNPHYRLDKRALLVLCADNGVVRQGVSPVDASVTALLAKALAKGNICTCKMAAVANVDVIGVDMGMNENLALPELLDRRIAAGTADLSQGPAMSREQALQAIGHGFKLAGDCQQRGFNILCTGELGIGNTTTSSAISAVLLKKSPAEVTGRGAGLSGEAVKKKAALIEQAIALNKPDPEDPLDVLAKLGGFDIAGMVGLYLGGAACRLPVLADGLISTTAALLAQKLCPAAPQAIFASHVSSEPAARWLLQALELEPLLTLDMRLGEGSGAVAALPLLDMAYAVYNTMISFESLLEGC